MSRHSTRQNMTRLRASHANRGELVADVGDFDIVHDDVAIKNLGDFRRLLAVGGDQQVVPLGCRRPGLPECAPGR